MDADAFWRGFGGGFSGRGRGSLGGIDICAGSGIRGMAVSGPPFNPGISSLPSSCDFDT